MVVCLMLMMNMVDGDDFDCSGGGGNVDVGCDGGW
jgi:hypothetical protein